MNGLADEGFLVAAGPLAGSERGRVRVLLIADAGDEQEIHERLADDPWAKGGQLRIVSAEPWNVLAGAAGKEKAPPPRRATAPSKPAT